MTLSTVTSPPHGSRCSHIGSGFNLVGDDRIAAAGELTTPRTLMTSVPAPDTFAPMAFRKFARSTICGSFAQFSMIVMPLQRTAASRMFIVAPTETMSGTHGRPGGRHRAHCADIAAQLLDARAHRLKALDVLVDGTPPKLQPPGMATRAWPKRPELCADEIVGSADAAHEVNRCRRVPHVRAVDLERVPAEAADVRAHIS